MPAGVLVDGGEPPGVWSRSDEWGERVLPNSRFGVCLAEEPSATMLADGVAGGAQGGGRPVSSLGRALEYRQVGIWRLERRANKLGRS